MEQLNSILEAIAVAIDLVGIAILVFAALKFIVHFLAFEIKRLRGLEYVDVIRDLRLGLGSYILLSLEFMILSDIINSAILLNMNDLLLLGVLVIIRTALSFFLGLEMSAVKNQQ